MFFFCCASQTGIWVLRFASNAPPLVPGCKLHGSWPDRRICFVGCCHQRCSMNIMTILWQCGISFVRKVIFCVNTSFVYFLHEPNCLSTTSLTMHPHQHLHRTKAYNLYNQRREAKRSKFLCAYQPLVTSLLLLEVPLSYLFLSPNFRTRCNFTSLHYSLYLAPTKTSFFCCTSHPGSRQGPDLLDPSGPSFSSTSP